MSTKWYGSLQNRLAEGKQYCEEIKVGDGVTEYSWSDRTPYEVIEVIDQKHIRIRMLDHIHVGDGCMDNNWELISNENNPVYYLTKRGSVWYFTSTITREDIERAEAETAEDEKWYYTLRLVQCGFDPEKIREKGKQTKYRKANISIGVASYYYDYEF